MAVAAAILTAIYWMLKRGQPYHDLGPDHFDKTNRARLATRLAKKLDEPASTLKSQKGRSRDGFILARAI